MCMYFIFYSIDFTYRGNATGLDLHNPKQQQGTQYMLQNTAVLIEFLMKAFTGTHLYHVFILSLTYSYTIVALCEMCMKANSWLRVL